MCTETNNILIFINYVFFILKKIFPFFSTSSLPFALFLRCARRDSTLFPVAAQKQQRT